MNEIYINLVIRIIDTKQLHVAIIDDAYLILIGLEIDQYDRLHAFNNNVFGSTFISLFVYISFFH